MLMLRVLNWYNLPIPAMIGYILVTPPPQRSTPLGVPFIACEVPPTRRLGTSKCDAAESCEGCK